MDYLLVSESFTNNYIVQAGSYITKQWRLQNIGTQSIPMGTRLQLVDSKANVYCKPILRNVAVG